MPSLNGIIVAMMFHIEPTKREHLIEFPFNFYQHKRRQIKCASNKCGLRSFLSSKAPLTS